MEFLQILVWVLKTTASAPSLRYIYLSVLHLCIYVIFYNSGWCVGYLIDILLLLCSGHWKLLPSSLNIEFYLPSQMSQYVIKKNFLLKKGFKPPKNQGFGFLEFLNQKQKWNSKLTFLSYLKYIIYQYLFFLIFLQFHC